ncbi:SitI3 family protein [Nocardia sp. CDC153]|uniref:SitI3 family protein n=1 Tax=Nocardia sp. CDC153 TaxID=3112167 RepID=UPI002DBF5212|nr:SitI3 family protein [Nocardia sp. CDC153]MEC3953268.1 SitI3 family protein [Nocardia sp. CDC153]
MISSYRFDLAIDLPLDTFARVVRDLARPAAIVPSGTRATELLAGVVNTSGLWIRAEKPDPVENRADTSGRVPVACIRFRLAELGDEQRQADDIARLVADTLASLPGDAQLISEHRTVWLRRRDNDLVLNADNTFWQPHRQRLLLEPFERETASLAS